jgi:hypothetical protein
MKKITRLPAVRPEPESAAGDPPPAAIITRGAVLTATLRDGIVTDIAAGLRPHEAALKNGISRAVFRDWMDAAEKSIEPYASLNAAIETAEVALKAALL